MTEIVEQYLNERANAYEIYKELAKQVEYHLEHRRYQNTKVSPPMEWGWEFESWLKERKIELSPPNTIYKLREAFASRIAQIAQQVADRYSAIYPDAQIKVSPNGNISIGWKRGVLWDITHKDCKRQVQRGELSSLMGGWLLYLARAFKMDAWREASSIVHYQSISQEQEHIEIRVRIDHSDLEEKLRVYDKGNPLGQSLLCEEHTDWLKYIYIHELINGILYELSAKLPDKLEEGYAWVYEYNIRRRDLPREEWIHIRVWLEGIER